MKPLGRGEKLTPEERAQVERPMTPTPTEGAERERER